jgi:hypothetical protein
VRPREHLSANAAKRQRRQGSPTNVKHIVIAPCLALASQPDKKRNLQKPAKYPSLGF